MRDDGGPAPTKERNEVRREKTVRGAVWITFAGLGRVFFAISEINGIDAGADAAAEYGGLR